MSWIRLSFVLARRDLVNRYKWSKAGLLWPLLSFAIYAISISVVYSKVFSIELRSYLPYLTSGIAAWQFVQGFLVEGVNLYVTFKGLIINIRIPFWVYHLSLAFKLSMLFILQLPIIFVIKSVNQQDFFPGIFFLPISMVLVGFIGVMVSRIVSIVGTIFRDFAHLTPSIAAILTLITPILFPVSLLSDAKWLYHFNPMYYLVSVVRDSVTGTIPKESHLTISVLLAIVLFFLAEFLDRLMVKRIVPII